MKSEKSTIPLLLALVVLVAAAFSIVSLTSETDAACPPENENPPAYGGGEVSVDFQGQSGGSFSFMNGCLQPIHDVYLTIHYTNSWGSGNPNPNPTPESNIAIDGDEVSWGTPVYQDGAATQTKTIKKDGRQTQGGGDGSSCPNGKPITVQVQNSSNPPDCPIESVDAWFTDKWGTRIMETFFVDTDFIDNNGGGMGGNPLSIHYPAWYNWSRIFVNDSDYLIKGFIFSEIPVQTMAAINTSRLASTSADSKTVNFVYPLKPHTGGADVRVIYSTIPTASLALSCLPLISKVIPESADSGQIVDLGTGVSVPDITISEASVGAIDDDLGTGEIVLTPRNSYEFASISTVFVTEGNILLGTAYIFEGAIRIPVIFKSTIKSSITLGGMTISTLQGLSQGVLSVYQTEPGGNNSNFPYCTHAILEGGPPNNP
jgi:hypothetical protein